jgi:hypothetical protein
MFLFLLVNGENALDACAILLNSETTPNNNKSGLARDFRIILHPAPAHRRVCAINNFAGNSQAGNHLISLYNRTFFSPKKPSVFFPIFT